MATISEDKIAALLGKGRARGAYDPILEDFLTSDEAGIEVELTGVLAGKSAATVKQSLEACKRRMAPKANTVRVIVDEDAVFLVNTAHVS